MDEIELWKDNPSDENSVVRSMRCPRCKRCYPLTQRMPSDAWLRQTGRLVDDKPGVWAFMRYGSCLVCGCTTSADGEPPMPRAEVGELEMDAVLKKQFASEALAEISALPEAPV